MGAKRTTESLERKAAVGKAFSQKLRDAMKFHEVRTQLQLVLRSGLDQATISHLLNGKKIPDLEQLAQLALAFGCEASALVPHGLAQAAIPSQGKDK
jgi:transcriptional regulator with XRE-family HTH domain